MQLGRPLRSITHHVWMRPTVVSLRSYIATRKTTAIIFCVSIVVLASCLISIWKIYAVDKPLTQVTIMPAQIWSSVKFM